MFALNTTIPYNQWYESIPVPSITRFIHWSPAFTTTTLTTIAPTDNRTLISLWQSINGVYNVSPWSTYTWLYNENNLVGWDIAWVRSITATWWTAFNINTNILIPYKWLVLSELQHAFRLEAWITWSGTTASLATTATIQLYSVTPAWTATLLQTQTFSNTSNVWTSNSDPLRIITWWDIIVQFPNVNAGAGNVLVIKELIAMTNTSSGTTKVMQRIGGRQNYMTV